MRLLHKSFPERGAREGERLEGSLGECLLGRVARVDTAAGIRVAYKGFEPSLKT